MRTNADTWLELAPEADDRDRAGAWSLIESFDLWLTARLDEARRAGKDLAFFDTDLERQADGSYLGWAHVLLEPGRHPPLGAGWTVYRL